MYIEIGINPPKYFTPRISALHNQFFKSRKRLGLTFFFASNVILRNLTGFRLDKLLTIYICQYLNDPKLYK